MLLGARRIKEGIEGFKVQSAGSRPLITRVLWQDNRDCTGGKAVSCMKKVVRTSN